MLKRFLWSYIGLCVLPFLLLGVLVANFSSESIQEELLNAVEISMDESYRSITGIMSSAREISLTLMNEPDLQRQLHALEEESADKAQILEELGSWLETYPIYGSNRMKLCLYLQNLPQDSLEPDTELVIFFSTFFVSLRIQALLTASTIFETSKAQLAPFLIMILIDIHSPAFSALSTHRISFIAPPSDSCIILQSTLYQRK